MTFAEGPLGLTLTNANEGKFGDATLGSVFCETVGGQGTTLGVQAVDHIVGIEGRADFSNVNSAIALIKAQPRPLKVTFMRPGTAPRVVKPRGSRGQWAVCKCGQGTPGHKNATAKNGCALYGTKDQKKGVAFGASSASAGLLSTAAALAAWGESATVRLRAAGEAAAAAGEVGEGEAAAESRNIAAIVSSAAAAAMGAGAGTGAGATGAVGAVGASGGSSSSATASVVASAAAAMATGAAEQDDDEDEDDGDSFERWVRENAGELQACISTTESSQAAQAGFLVTSDKWTKSGAGARARGKRKTMQPACGCGQGNAGHKYATATNGCKNFKGEAKPPRVYKSSAPRSPSNPHGKLGSSAGRSKGFLAKPCGCGHGTPGHKNATKTNGCANYQPDKYVSKKVGGPSNFSSASGGLHDAHGAGAVVGHHGGSSMPFTLQLI